MTTLTPYRTAAIVASEPQRKPKWRIVKRNGFKYRLQRRVWFFWWTVGWFNELSGAIMAYEERTEPAVVRWTDIDGEIGGGT